MTLRRLSLSHALCPFIPPLSQFLSAKNKRERELKEEEGKKGGGLPVLSGPTSPVAFENK